MNTQGSEWKIYVNAVLRTKIVAYKLPFKKQREKMELWKLSSHGNNHLPTMQIFHVYESRYV